MKPTLQNTQLSIPQNQTTSNIGNTQSGTGTISPNLPTRIPDKVQESLKSLLMQCYYQYQQNWNIRQVMAQTDRAYACEGDRSKENLDAIRANLQGDKNRFRNIVMPIISPQVEGSVVYQTSVFLTGTPLFGVSASPEYEDEALQLETIIDEQSNKGGWVREIGMFFRDGAKYNISALECTWDKIVTWAPDTLIGGKNNSQNKQIIWEGNCIHRWDMYNTFFDTRVAPSEMHKKGEFIGRTELMSRIRLKQFIAELPLVQGANIQKAFESNSSAINIANTTSGIMNYYIPDINPGAILNSTLISGTNWLAWVELTKEDNGIRYNNMYEVTTVYIRILPSDFGLNVPKSNTPQIWKFIWVNHQVLLYAELQTNAHNMFPVIMGQPIEDGLNYQTKSLAQNVSPIQDIVTALSNSDIAARRRALSDRTLYDPSRVEEKHINNPNPSAKIPIRPSAYGKPLQEAVFPFPFRDDQSQFIQQKIQSYSALANMISGQNPARQGQFVKGNKTQSEFDTVMNNANGRDQITAINYEAQVFSPLKEIIKTNILQYQGGISLYNTQKGQQVNIDPVALRKAILNFKVSDGLTPTDKLMDSDTNMVALQMIGQSEQIGSAYNIAPLFSYLMKTRGAHISEFEKSPAQQAYESAQQQYQQTILQLYKQNPQQDPTKLPPAPKPQDYGYNPSSVQVGQDSSQTATGGGQQPPTTQGTNPVSQALSNSTSPPANA